MAAHELNASERPSYAYLVCSERVQGILSRHAHVGQRVSHDFVQVVTIPGRGAPGAPVSIRLALVSEHSGAYGHVP